VIGYLDCSTGVSGDKFLGALIDVGEVSGDFTAEQLQQLVSAFAPEGRVVVERTHSHGIAAVSVRVEATSEPPTRTWESIRNLIGGAPLPTPVRDRALDAFGELALAEAHAHGTKPQDVHFHEVGALDSILDVVGVCAGLQALGVGHLLASPVAVGGGTVNTSHGILPVPAPATAALLVGVPTTPGPSGPGGAAPGELTTPTGAALLRACVDGFGPWPEMMPVIAGYGAGTRDIGTPNVCRLVLGLPVGERPALETQAVTLLESNIDHLAPEALAFTAEQLLGEGALDVWTSPIVMKKGRSAVTLSLLVPLAQAQHFAERTVALAGTLGVRRTDLERFVAERDSVTVETSYGPVRYKVGAGRSRPEADDVARIARDAQRPYFEIERELTDLFGPR
jgi:hypothetical protein